MIPADQIKFDANALDRPCDTCGGKQWAHKDWWHPNDRRWRNVVDPDAAFDVRYGTCPDCDGSASQSAVTSGAAADKHDPPSHASRSYKIDTSTAR